VTLSDQVRAALAEGRAAAENRQPAENPYRTTENPPSLAEQALANAWRKGYQSVTSTFPIDLSR
jgi:hypothetical protein